MPAIVTNLSEHGCQLRLLDGCEAGSLSLADTFEVAFCVNGEPFRIQAQLRMLAGSGLCGMAFLQPSPRSKLRLRELTAELQQGVRVYLEPVFSEQVATLSRG